MNAFMVTWVSTLDDVAKRGMVILLECRCGRSRWLGADDLIGKKVNGHLVRGHHRYVEVAQQLRCGGCGKRGPGINPKFPDDVGVPKGVPALPFLQADDRERKRMIRQTRG